MKAIKNKIILIIGGTGSLGQSLVEYFYKSNQLFIVSRDETKQWLMQNKYLKYNINYYLCDIRDCQSLRKAILFLKPDVIINASAIKQVPTCEMFPYESVKTNVIGVENLIEICTQHYEPEVVVGVSTDKACKPVNVYGMCKAIGERLYIAANAASKTRFLCVRYGNVLESRGSIIPLFRYRSCNDKVYPITHINMTRFFISLDESVALINAAIIHGKKGDTFVPFVKSGRIKDLAEIFIERFGGRIEVTGIRPGEKMHEELINEEEIRRTYQLSEDYLIIKPFISKLHPNYDLIYREDTNVKLPKTRLKRYSSDLTLFSKDRLCRFLEERKIFENKFEGYSENEVKF